MNKKISIILTMSIIFIGIGGFYTYKRMNLKIPNNGTIVNYSVPQLSKEDLMIKSDLIIKGTIKKTNDSKYSDKIFKDGKNSKKTQIVTTDSIVKIEEVYKGLPYDNKSIVVRNEGGYIKGNQEKFVVFQNHPKYKNNDSVILFLKKDTSGVDNGENYYILTGMKQGNFKFNRIVNNDSEFISDNYYILESTLRSDIVRAIEYNKSNPELEMSQEEVQKNNEKFFGKSDGETVTK